MPYSAEEAAVWDTVEGFVSIILEFQTACNSKKFMFYFILTPLVLQIKRKAEFVDLRNICSYESSRKSAWSSSEPEITDARNDSFKATECRGQPFDSIAREFRGLN